MANRKRTTRKPRVTMMTYRAPFKAENGAVLDSLGFAVVYFLKNEHILVGKMKTRDASEVVAEALNAYLKRETSSFAAGAMENPEIGKLDNGLERQR